ANQMWTPQPDGTLKNPASGRCVEAGATPAPGAQLVLADCTGALTQQWTHLLTDADGLQGFLRERTSLDNNTPAVTVYHEPTATQTALRDKPITRGHDW